jgi:sialate O-acetylesterase
MKKNMQTRMVLTILVGLIASVTLNAAAKDAPADKPKPAIELGAPFGDNAVLQRQMKIPVWGWSKPGVKVTVQFAGQKKTAAAAKDGKWMLQLDKLKASFKPAEMVITDDAGKTVTLKNILVGEVWMASGQSNMQWKVTKSSCNKLKVEPVDGVAPIREFEITSVYAALHPIEKATGPWKNGDYTNYSAIAFAFAHKLYGELNVPIGILNCCFSQTSIQAWVPRVGFRNGKDEYTKAIYQKILETDPTTPDHKAAWDKFYQGLEDAMKENDARIKKGLAPKKIDPKTPGNLGGNRDASWMFNGRLNAVIPYAIRGAIWNQGYANMGEGLPYYNHLHSLVRGWRMRWDTPDLPVYFHQFYSSTMKHMGKEDNSPVIGGAAEMRLGTWLARDIPNTGMASQIDITGGIHYSHKAVPGQRLALHALKNQYGKKVVADGPMYKSYTVKGDKLIVEFDNAQGGLAVAETGSNATDRKNGTGFANPKVIENGDDKVKLFYLAGDDRVWHPASMKLEGDKAVLTSPKVKKPCGVSYAAAGVGFQPNLYNKAMLPMTPFIYYDDKMVLSRTWPDEKLKVAGVVIDPGTIGKKNEYRRMPLLSTQFRENAVFQAGVPLTIWGSAIHPWGYEAKGKAVVKFSFAPRHGSGQAGIEKTIPVTPGMREWKVTLPPMKASAEPRTLKVSFTIDGELAHERVCKNIVIGDVWYVAAPPMTGAADSPVKSSNIVRMMTRKAKRFKFPRASRYSVCVSTTPLNRFACRWEDASGFAAALGHRIAAKTGKPVGIVFMQSGMYQLKGSPAVNQIDLKSWISPDCLNLAPSLMEDYKDLGAVTPGNPYYNANVRRYAAAWKNYWSKYVPQMMKTKRVPDGVTWGGILNLSSSVTSTASEVYNVMTHSFTPASFKGIIFLSSQRMFETDQGANYGAEISALANCWKAKFGGEDTQFFYTIPSEALAPKITKPTQIKGKSASYELGRWLTAQRGDKEGAAAIGKQLTGLLDAIVNKAYK